MTVPLTNATTTVSASELLQADVVDSNALEAMYSAEVMRPLVEQINMVGRGPTYRRAAWPVLTATDNLAETTDLTPVQIDTSQITASVKEIGISVVVTDRLDEDDVLAGLAQYGEQGGKAISDKRDSDIAALLAGHTQIVGTISTTLTVATFQSAIALLNAQDAPKPYVAVLHPTQVHQLSRDIVTSQASVWTGASDSDWGNGMQDAYFGRLLNVDIFQTTNVPLVAGAPNSYQGGMFSRGQAHGFLDKRPVRTEFERDASARATEIVLTSRYGVVEFRDLWGVTIVSSTSTA